MRRRKSFLAVAVLAVALSALTTARTQLPENIRPRLIARSHPELASIDSLYVTVIPSGRSPNEYDPTWRDLAQQVRHKLSQAGIKVLTAGHDDKPISPRLVVYIDLLRLSDSKQRVFHIRTCLSRIVRLDLRPVRSAAPVHIPADVWKTSSPVTLTSMPDPAGEIEKTVISQTETFIVAWIAANPPGRETTNVGETSVPGTKQTRPPTEPPPSGANYVASKNSKVFHRPDCSSARRISAHNLVTYRTRTEAINAGKRPCKICKP